MRKLLYIIGGIVLLFAIVNMTGGWTVWFPAEVRTSAELEVWWNTHPLWRQVVIGVGGTLGFFLVAWLFLWLLNTLFGGLVTVGGHVVSSINRLAPLVLLALVYILFRTVDPSLANALDSAIPFPLQVASLLALGLMTGLMSGTSRWVGVMAFAVVLVWIYVKYVPSCALSDASCIAVREKAEEDERKKRIVSAEERVIRELQQKRLAAPPPDSQCTNLWETLRIGPTPVAFNQGGSCRWQMKSAGNCFKATRAAWTKDNTVYSICDQGAHTYTEVPEAIESLWTADGRVATVLMLKYPDPLTRRDLHLVEKLATSIFGKH